MNGPAGDAGDPSHWRPQMHDAWLDAAARAQLETPAVIVDLDRVDARIGRMAAIMRERGVALRPHAKTHKSLAIARRQLQAGAVGLTVATVGEAELFADGGVGDLFIAYPVIAVGPRADRLLRLTDRCRLSVGADSIEGLRALAAIYSGAPNRPAVLVEIDCGGRRSGVRPETAGSLARQAVDLGLPVVGVFTHAGHGYAEPARGALAADEEVAGLTVAAEALAGEGIEPTIVSAGSTPTAVLSARGPVTEERPGSYVFGDRQQSALAGERVDRADSVALVVAATVVSHGSNGGFLVDAGAKILGKDVAPYLAGHGMVLDYPAAVLARLYDHHAVAEVAAGTPVPDIGEIVFIVPNHVCPVINLVDQFFVTHGGQGFEPWPVDARGRNT